MPVRFKTNPTKTPVVAVNAQERAVDTKPLPTLPSHRAYVIKDLKPIHEEMCRLKVLHGYKHKVIAEILNVTPQNVSDVLNSPLAVRKLEELQSIRDLETIDISKTIKNKTALNATIVIDKHLSRKVEMMMEDKEALLTANDANIAKSVLEMAGHGVDKNAHKHLHMHLTGEDLEKMAIQNAEVVE